MDEFCAITGVDADTSAMYMEMGGYDLDTAIQLFFSMNDGGGGETEARSGSTSCGAGWPHDWIDLLFSSSSGCNIPEAWLNQGLQTSPPCGDSSTPWSHLSLLQHKNGPCGVLAAYQGYLITHLLENCTLSPTYSPTLEDVTGAVIRLLRGVGPVLKFCSWTDPIHGVGGSVVIHTEDGDRAAQTLLTVIAQYLAPGGVLLLLYSVIQTFGVESLQQHSSLLPLLYGPNTLCSSALMNILLTGEARESLGAFDDFGAALPWNKPPAAVGLLSGTEIELKMKIHDGLKFPTHEVYVLHGRDHFTTLLVLPDLPMSPTLSSSSSMTMVMPTPLPYQNPAEGTTEALTVPVSFRVVHFNGLPPAGPAISQMRVTAPEGVCRLSAPTAALGMAKEYKPTLNTIDCIVQASASDKAAHPKEWNRWKYEVALTIDDPDNHSEERPKHLPPLPTFDLKLAEIDPTEGWRCRLCFETRFATMCFGQNDAGSTHCQHCSRSREEVGWTMWLSYADIPPSWQASVDRQYGPMFSTVLRTKWPDCKVEYEADKDLPVV